MRSCGRARDSVTRPDPGASGGRGRVNWTGPGRTGVFPATPRAGDRAGITIYHQQHRQAEWLSLFEAACGPPARAA